MERGERVTEHRLLANRANAERRTLNAMAGTEKELILLGLFLIVAVNEDSAVVSGAILSYKPSVAAFRCLLPRYVDERFRRLRRVQIWRPEIARIPLDAQTHFTRKGATRINFVRKIWRVRHGLQPIRAGDPNRSSGSLRSP